MIILESVTLRNWRLVNDACFKPLAEGITGLSGVNGVGKSSFLTGTLWALYAVTPDGVNVAGLRRQTTAHTEDCFVAVVFKHAGQRIEVIREIRGKNNTVRVTILVDGIEATHTSVKVANTWIRNRLGIDVDAFTTAFVVRQKELDSLVKATASERRATIERLSGIEQMSLSLKSARDEENGQRREVSTLSGSGEDVNFAQITVQEKEADVVIAAEIEDDAQRELSELEARHKDISQAYSQKEASEQRLENLRTDVRNARLILQSAQKSVSDQRAHVTPATSADMEAANKAVEDASTRLSEAREHYSSVKNQKNSLESRISHNEESITKISLKITTLKSRLTQLEELSTNVETHENTLKTLRERAESLSAQKQAHSSEIDALSGQSTRLQRSINTLTSEDAHDAQCPTCHTVLEDSSGLLKDFNEQFTSLINRSKEIVQLKNSLESDIKEIKREITDADILLRDSHAAIVEISQVENNINELTETLTQHDSDLLTARENLTELPSLEEIAKDGKEANALYADAFARQAKIEEGVRSVQRLTSLESERDILADALDSAEGELIVLAKREALATNVFSEVSLAQARAEVRNMGGEVEQQRSIVAGLTTKLRVLEEKLHAARNDLSREENLYARKKSGLELLSAKSAVSDVLDEFRKDRIARVAPELSEIATSLISEMTSGRYTEVILDENFTPTVIDEHGNVRPVAWLSGGEESTVALALRIAIGDMMTGGTGGLLWLDEVLTAQDASRRSSLLNTLRGLSGRQIVMINHTAGADDMVDKVINLVGTDDGSFIEDTRE